MPVKQALTRADSGRGPALHLIEAALGAKPPVRAALDERYGPALGVDSDETAVADDPGVRWLALAQAIRGGFVDFDGRIPREAGFERQQQGVDRIDALFGEAPQRIEIDHHGRHERLDPEPAQGRHVGAAAEPLAEVANE